MKPILYLVRDLPGQDLSALREVLDVRGGGPTAPPRERLVELAKGAAVLVPTYIDRVDAALLDALPTVRHVASYGVGVNHIDLGKWLGEDYRIPGPRPGDGVEAPPEAEAPRADEDDR